MMICAILIGYKEKNTEFGKSTELKVDAGGKRITAPPLIESNVS